MNPYFTISIIIIIILVYFLYLNDTFQIWLLNRIIVLRGILSPNCFWYKISDMILYDGAGVNLYNKYKNTYGDFALTNMFGENIYLVTNNKYIQIILDNSPVPFSVGKLKQQLFQSFMKKNVGVSTGCPWKKRRHINEYALSSDMLHIYSSRHNQHMNNNLIKWKHKKTFAYDDFVKLGKRMASQVVFNTNKVSDDIFNIFIEANSTSAFNDHFKISSSTHNKYITILKHYIRNPVQYSLVKLLVDITNDKDEIIHQIPHFIFPIVGLFVTTIPRLLVLLSNHKHILQKVINEIVFLENNTHDYLNSNLIYKLTYLRKCILETLRLNNPVITTFRTLERNFSFDEKYKFKKGTQFVILNNPVLREKEYFYKPNKFIPERWTKKTEKSYYAISFNQGPQRCPGKELAIYLVQSFIYNFIKVKNITHKTIINTLSLDTDNIPQVINPCSIQIQIK